MSMRYFTLWLFCCCMVSCSYFENKKVDATDLVNEELKTINWNDVDDYPMFPNCDSSNSKTERKACFEQTIQKAVIQKISRPIVVTKAMNDTILIDFEISNSGILVIRNVQVNAEVSEQIPMLDSLLRSSLSELPQISPALKRGQPVNTKFTLPIIVSSN